jgi:hypothetical protein
MPIFYEKAIRVGVNGDSIDWLRQEHLADWNGLADALDYLTPEQRCDAIYADWLLRLNENRTLILPIRDYLIGQGALSANYLAELAQNADDAADGVEAEIRIVPNGEWLFVSNNGRKITSLNLLGLSRFFVHSAGKVVELNDQTIGRFGIGFKSCYRIASEVFVFTWDGKSNFGFRLPICREGDTASVPDTARLEILLNRLRDIGEIHLDAELQSLRCLGYCTPEFSSELRHDLAEKTKPIRIGERGTVFCFRVRPDRQDEVRRRITGQAHELYELCPLFLPNVRTVQLAQNTLAMKLTRHNPTNDLPGRVKAVKVELTTRSPGQDPSSSRFWRLEGSAADDLWQVALHADSQHRLRVEREDDERGATLKDGAAYAFFPLNSVSWPFRLHLHIKLPTNLARDNWNHDERAQIDEQIQRAVDGVTAWLEAHTDKWHPNWRVESLVVRKPNANEIWAWRFWEQFQTELRSKRLLRTLWGHPVSAQDARTVRIVARDAARDNWSKFCASLAGLEADFPIVNAANVGDFGLTELPDNVLRAFFLKVAPQLTQDSERRALVTALFSIESAEPETLERVAAQVEVPCSDGTLLPLSKLLQRPGGADLPDEWHILFNTLRNWFWDLPHGLTAVFDGQLRFQLKKLAAREFNPRWEAVPVALGIDQAWVEHGAAFWKQDREGCPAGCRKTVVQSLRVKDGTNLWKPISIVWLADSSPVNCFHDSVDKWDRGLAPNNDAQKLIREKLRAWGLWDEWEDAVEHRLVEKLSKSIYDNLTKKSETHPGVIHLEQPFETVFQGAHANSRDQLPTRWKAIVREAEHEAIRKFLRDHRASLVEVPLLGSDIEQDLAGFLTATKLFARAPRWLSPFALEAIRAAVVANPLESFSFIQKSDLTEQCRRELAESCLKEFYRWSMQTFSEPFLQAFHRLCEVTPATQRGNWSIGITSRTTILLRDLLNSHSPPHEPLSADAEAHDDSTLNRQLLALDGVRWLQSQHLPDLLRRVPAVAGASLDSGRLKVEVTPGSTPLPALEADVSSETRSNPIFRSLLQRCDGRLARCDTPLSVRWLNGQTIVAEIREAHFAVMEGQLITTRVQRVLDDQQFTEVLSLYARSARGGHAFEEFQQAWTSGNVSHAELYATHRKSVVPTLLKIQVTDQGYREHHVVRELLQNAESAYDSKPGELPANCEFEFVLRPPATTGAWEAVVIHSGRYFNEPVWNRRLNKAEDRDDIRLIVSTPSSESPPTEGWVGRFNRGFKSVFTVAETVEVVSGPHRFAIQDMLILTRANPQPSPDEFSTQTRFSFRCTKTNALKLLDLKSADGQQRAIPIFDPSSFVFLQRVNRVRIQADKWVWEWSVDPKPHSGEWNLVDVKQSFPARKDRFLVRRGEIGGASPQRFAVALRLDAESLNIQPAKLDGGWHNVRLTFATEDDFPLDFLVNGDFETDSGRLGIRNNATNENLLATCLKSVRELCETEVGASCEPQRWLAWADALHLAKGEEELTQRFEHHKTLVKEWETASEFLCKRIPHAGEAVPVEDLTIPTSLVRRLETFVMRWGFPVRNWIGKEIEARLPRKVREECPKQSLDVLLELLPREVMEKILADFSRPEFLTATDQLAGPEKDELERAQRLLERSLTPFTITGIPNWPPEPWSVAQFWQEWESQGQPTEQYTLDGVNWTLLFPQDQTPCAERPARLKECLQNPQTDDGKNAWYRILGFACLMSGAGHGRIESLRRFWTEELDSPERDFWSVTAGHDFNEATTGLFNELALRQANPNAQGEWADYWRHIFYDVRKVHELIWNQEFADTILKLLIDPQRAIQLPHFLRDGQLPGQQPWSGVLGQSAGAPLFFLTREFCRLGLANSDELRRLAFFVCTPVRRAAERIGWLEPGASSRTDFRSLAMMSEKLFERISKDDEYAGRFLQVFDIPLLHIGLNW